MTSTNLLSNIPSELRQIPLWLAYYLRREKDGKKPRKHPFVKWAASEDRAQNLKPLDELLSHPYKTAAGYQIYVQQPYVYIDIDHCRDPQTGLVTEEANEIVTLLDTYTEISSSGEGLRLVCRGKIARDHKVEGDPVEVYGGHISKIMAMTGDVVNWTYTTIEDRQSQLDQLMAQLQPHAAPMMTVKQALEEWLKENTSWKPEDDYTLESMSNVQMKELHWLWRGRIPKGKLTLFAASPGRGKSLATCSMASIVTNGNKFPHTDEPCEAAQVLMLACEDDIDDTVAPRLAAADAKLDMVKYMYLKDRQQFTLADLSLLKKCLQENPEIKLVIFDPITSYLGKGVSPFKEDQVRGVLIPLAALARDLNVTFILVAHFNKRSDVDALGKILGAGAFAGVCRSAWMFEEVKDKETEETHLEMMRGKLNLGPPAKSIRYEIRSKKIPQLSPTADPLPYIMWGDETDTKADDVLDARKQQPERGVSKREQALGIIKTLLADGAKPQSEVEKMMKAAGISWRTAKSAKGDAGVRSVKRDGRWWWELIDEPEVPALTIFSGEEGSAI